MIDQEEFLLQHLTEGKSYKAVTEEFGVPRQILQEWWNSGVDLKNQIKKSNSLFSNRKDKEEFLEFQQAGKRAFFEWYRKQPRICAYCGIEEYKLERLFAEGMLSSKRGRGRSLELERRDAKSNKYTEKNCVLACYFCNNHKSDIISEKDHQEYFSNQIRKYLENKFEQLKANDNR